MSNRDVTQDLQLAFSLHRSGRFAEAEKAYRKIIRRNPGQPHALHSLGIIQTANGNHREAAQLMARSLLAEPANLDFMQNYATVLCQLAQFETAREICLKGLAINGGHVYLLYVLGGTLLKLGRAEEALATYHRLLQIEPNHVAALTERSSVLLGAERHEAALADIEKALKLDPNYAEAHSNRGLLHARLKRHDEAIAAYERALTLNPRSAEGWAGLGSVFAALQRFNDAGAAYERALSLNPGLTRAWLGYASILFALKRSAEALMANDKALALEPESVEVWRDRAYCLTNLGRHEDALAAYDKLHALKPDLNGVAGLRLQARMHCCAWQDFDRDCARLIESIEADTDVVVPFDCLPIPSSLDVRLKCAQSWVAKNYTSQGQTGWRGSDYGHDRLRVGYVSADFRQHPVAYLAAGLFEGHNRSRFDILGVSIGPNDGSEIRRRLEGAFDTFIDGAALTDDAIAERIRAEEIDLLVDLNGFTIGARTGIFARRPAPVQVNYLGFPGTMGASFYDYIVADPVLIPAEQQYGYAESIVRLPHSYMPHDQASRVASDRDMQRAEFGLPDRGFVFCCFNAAYKFNPDVFQSWMRLLKAVDSSVLWLAECNATAEANLRGLTAGAGVDRDRLIFARRLPSAADHLARLRLADLFLDTWPYNAHTTASDALWVGLPVLTRIGQTFAGRVAASLLTAVGLPELIVESTGQFESLAIELACEPARLAALKDKLACSRLASPLFDTKRLIADLETAYGQMHGRLRAGLRPEHIHLPG
jgi:protein O-GlcNAc transferase